MAETLRQRKSQHGHGFSAGLNTLEHFQAQIHYDPNDKPQIDEPLVAPDPNSLTLAWDQMPPWIQDNEYILKGYRRIQHSWHGCAVSVFGYLHNETVNILSHLFGSLLFCYLLGTFRESYILRFDSATWADVAVFSVFLVSAVTCLFFSAFFHTCSVHSKEASSRIMQRPRLCGHLLIVGSFFPCLYYGFYCDTAIQLFYLTLIVVAGAAASYIVINPEYRKPTHRGARTKVFIALGLCGIVPVTHAMIAHGFYKVSYEMGFGWLLASAVLYITGALLYANRIPERFSPGTFDYFAASHQIFHMHVLLAALAHYVCILTAFDHWHTHDPLCMI